MDNFRDYYLVKKDQKIWAWHGRIYIDRGDGGEDEGKERGKQ